MKLHAPDYKLISVITAIVLLGLVVLSSASSVLGYDNFKDSLYYVKHQLLLGLIPGVILMFVLSRIDYHVWRKYSRWFFIASIVLLLLVFIPGLGLSLGGARSWIVIGGMSLQPAELVKLFFLLFLASWLEERTSSLDDWMHGLVPFMGAFGVVALLIMLQPDTGTMSIIAVMSVAVYFVAGAPWKHIGALFAGGIAGLGLLIAMAPYRMARFTTFLNPDMDTQGAGYHLKQSLLAIGSGGFLGLGLGHSRQKFSYLPEPAGDSIFAVGSEELGFIFSFIMVSLFIYFIVRGITISRKAPDMFGKLLAIGLVTWVGWQAIMNIGAMVGILPLTGVPLPMVSYGGTALMTVLAALGILINISKQTGEVRVQESPAGHASRHPATQRNTSRVVHRRRR